MLMDAKHQFLYHLIMFISFVTAILIFPFIKTQTESMVTNAMLQLVLPYVVAYALAIYLLPKLLSSLFMSFGRE
jgi:hypothetical protein